MVFGHSHIPLNEVHDGQRIFNPGSPTDKRRQPEGTAGFLRIEDGELVAGRHRGGDLSPPGPACPRAPDGAADLGP